MGFSVTSNSTLRNLYGSYRDLVKAADRQLASDNSLSMADSSALKKAINTLKSSNYSEKEDLTETEGPAKSYDKKLKAFLDTYNYTLESSKKNKSSDLSRQANKMKKLMEKYKYELSEAGISYDKDGYLKASSSMSIKSTKRFEKIFGEGSTFMSELSDIAGTIKRHVNVVL